MKRKSLVVLFLLGLFGLSFVSTNREVELNGALQQFDEFYRALDLNYVDTLKHSELINKAIGGAIGALDPHSYYYSAEQSRERRKTWKGILYGGIGANVKHTEQGVQITYCRKGYGADSVGLLPGDIFYAVGDSLLAGKDLAGVVGLLKGDDGTPVKVTVLRSNEKLEKTIIRKEIVEKSVTYYELKDSIVTIRINQFLSGGGVEFRKILENYKPQGVKGVIIDLRTNPGGILAEANAVVSCFLPKGSLICSLKSQDKKSNYEELTKGEPILPEVPIVLLVNEKTISAAEVVSGALQDHDRAVVLGTKTYGKGLVQGTRYLNDGSSLYVTAARYFLPSGRCIQNRDYTNSYIVASSANDTTNFYTVNNRLMISGDAIHPDLKIEKKPSNNFVELVLKTDLIFDFAVKYRQQHLDCFLQKNTAALFITYLKENANHIVTSDENLLEQFSNENGNFDKEIASIRKKITKSKEQKIDEHSQELTLELNRTLIWHCSYNEGLYSYNLQFDEVYKKGLWLQHHTSEYQKLLGLE